MKELQWNKLPRKDYFYFVLNRAMEHTRCFLDAFPQCNCMYLCLKDNGDMNAVHHSFKIVPTLRPLYTFQKFYDLKEMLHARVYNDLCLGNIGHHCYLIRYGASGNYFLYVTELRHLKERHRIIKRLRLYRAGLLPSAINRAFDENFNEVKSLGLKIITEPMSKKAKPFFRCDWDTVENWQPEVAKDGRTR